MASVLSRIQIILEANTANYNNELRRARENTDSTFTKMRKGAAKMALGAGVAIAGLGVTSLKVAGNFEAAMGGVQAVSNATGKDFDALRDKAKELGSTTAFSATQAANGMEFLAMSGMKTEQILGTIPHALSLAAAGGIELAQSADIMSNIMTGMGLKAEDSARAADVLAKAAASSNVNISMLGESMKYVAPIAKQLGMSLEETAGMVGVLGNAGIQGSEAGTALRSVYARFSTHNKALGHFKAMGINIKDASGEMKSMTTLVGELAVGMKDMKADERLNVFKEMAGTEAMSALAVSVDAMADGSLPKLTKELENSEGAAKKMADIRMSGLNGELKGLASAWEGFLIELSDGGALSFAASGVKGLATGLRDITKGLPETITNIKELATTYQIVDRLKAAFEGVKSVLSSVGTVLAPVVEWFREHDKLSQSLAIAIGIVAVGFGVYTLAVSGAALAMTAFATAVAVATAPLTLILVGITALVTAGVYLYKNWDMVKTKAKEVFSTLPEPVQEMVRNVIQIFNVLKAFITPVILSIVAVVKVGFSSLVGIAKTAFDLVAGVVKIAFKTIAAYVTLGFNVVVAVFNTAFGLIKNGVKTGMNMVKALIKGDMQGVVDAFKGGFSNAVSIVASGIGNIIKAFAGLGNKLYTIGKDTIQGFINGVKERFAGALSVVTGFVENIKNAFTRAKGFDIHSPSRVMKKVGKNVVEGFTIGLSNNVGGAIKVADELVSSIKASFDVMKNYTITENNFKLGDAIKEANKSVIGSIQSLRKEIVLFGNDSKLAAFEYEVAFGSLKNASKEYLDEYRKGLIEIARLEANAEDLKAKAAVTEENTKNYNLLKDGLMTEEEKRLDLLKEQLAVITAMGDVAGSNDVVKNVLSGFGKLSDFVSIRDKTANQSESQKQTTAFNANVKSSEDEYTGKRNTLQGALYSEDTTVEQARLIQEQLTALEAEQSAKRRQYALDEAEIAKTAMQERLDFTGSVYSDMTNLVVGFTGENSRAAKAMFAVQKAHSIAMILLKAKEAMAVAMASAPFPTNLPAMGMVALKTGVLVAQASGLTGQAHDGLSNVPKEGTYLLDKNERVVRPSDNNKLTKFLDRADKGGTGNTITTHVTITGNTASVESNNSMGKELGNVINAAIDKKLRQESRQGGMLNR